MKWFVMSALIPLWGASCATLEVDKTIASQGEIVGQSFAEEVSSQSPHKLIKMSWREAKETMKVRNSVFVEAAETKAESTVKSPLIRSLVAHMQGSVNETMKGALDARELLSVMKAPVEELPKHFENMATVKDFSHNLQLKAYENANSASVSKDTLRRLEVELYGLFKKHKLLKGRMAQLETVIATEDVSTKLLTLAEKELELREGEYQKWLNQVRDFFNAEYADVQFTGSSNAFPSYRGIKDPQFHDWGRWKVLQREAKLAKNLKEEHKENKPVVPGSNFVKHKVRMMMHIETAEDSVESMEGMRSEVRSVLRGWRLLKENQIKRLAIKEQLRELEAGKGVKDKVEIELKKLNLQKECLILEWQEVEFAQKIWLIDEDCWPKDSLY